MNMRIIFVLLAGLVTINALTPTTANAEGNFKGVYELLTPENCTPFLKYLIIQEGEQNSTIILTSDKDYLRLQDSRVGYQNLGYCRSHSDVYNGLYFVSQWSEKCLTTDDENELGGFFQEHALPWITGKRSSGRFSIKKASDDVIEYSRAFDKQSEMTSVCQYKKIK